MAIEPLHVLLVLDDAADVELIRQVLQASDITNQLHVVKHGGKAISFLHREGEYSSVPRPDLILLGQQLQRFDGQGVLQHVNNEPDLCDIPLVVLSSANDSQNVCDTHELDVHATVPVLANSERIRSLVQDACGRSVAQVSLPHQRRSSVPDAIARSTPNPTHAVSRKQAQQ